MDALMMAIGTIKQQLEHVVQMQRDHQDHLDEIHDLLRKLSLQPPVRQSSIDWDKVKPRILWGATVLGLGTAQALFPGAERILSLLLSKL